MSAEKESLGCITVGVGTALQREVQIEAFIQVDFPDHRVISVARLEDGSICTTVENTQSSGRNPQSSIWLSKESFIGMITAANLYLLRNGENIDELLKDCVANKDIAYTCSKNLSPKQ